MNNLVIDNKGNQMVITINKKGFDEDYLISLIKRLQVEELTRKADFSSDVLGVAEEINETWWEENGDKFLYGVKK